MDLLSWLVSPRCYFISWGLVHPESLPGIISSVCFSQARLFTQAQLTVQTWPLAADEGRAAPVMSRRQLWRGPAASAPAFLGSDRLEGTCMWCACALRLLLQLLGSK